MVENFFGWWTGGTGGVGPCGPLAALECIFSPKKSGGVGGGVGGGLAT